MSRKRDIKDFFTDNQSLLQSHSINSCEEMVEALGDRYIHEKRDALMRALPEKEKAFLREYYLRNCKVGIDRCPACLKVIVNYKKGPAWTPVGRDYICEYVVEFDRIKKKATCKLRSNNQVEAKITACFDEEFENDFFEKAEHHYWDMPEREPHFGLDYDTVTVRCEFADGEIRDSGGNMPENESMLTYRTLYEKTWNIMGKWLDSIRL